MPGPGNLPRPRHHRMQASTLAKYECREIPVTRGRMNVANEASKRRLLHPITVNAVHSAAD